jgi:hypothetical protein
MTSLPDHHGSRIRSGVDMLSIGSSWTFAGVLIGATVVLGAVALALVRGGSTDYDDSGDEAPPDEREDT